MLVTALIGWKHPAKDVSLIGIVHPVPIHSDDRVIIGAADLDVSFESSAEKRWIYQRGIPILNAVWINVEEISGDPSAASFDDYGNAWHTSDHVEFRGGI